jgi:putative NADH-flavin reductase
MNIAIFGASGATGTLLTQRCLAAGHHVGALLRTPEKFPLRDRIRFVHGNAFDPSAVRQAVEGADVVLSALGASSPFKKEDVLERAIPVIIAAMPNAFDKQPAWRRGIFNNVINKTLLKWPLASQISQWQNLSRSNLDWTMVMPPMLTNTPAHGVYRIDGEALPRNGSRISRADVADFMMQQIDDPQWIKKGVYIAW